MAKTSKSMKTKLCSAAVLALFLSVGAQAQTDVHKAKMRPTPEERTARKMERKAQLAAMTPAERKAFKQAHQDQRQARLNAMTPEQRAKKVERRQTKKTIKRAGK